MNKLIFGLFFFFAVPTFSQNISLEQCEAQFLKNNLLLLANHYNIDISQAELLQEKIWDNPEFGFDINAWSPNEDKKFFNAGKYGQKSAYIQQLIRLGGQRGKSIDLAKTNAQLAELDFASLMQNLKFQLRSYFFTIYFDDKSIAQIDKQLLNLKTLIDNYTEQEAKGNIALKDVVRLQNLYLSLKTDRAELLNNLIENKKNLEILVSDGTEQNINPTPTEAELDVYQKPITNNLEDLQKTALENRPDYLKAIKQIEANNWNLKLQKSLSVPDVTIGAAYDQNGGAFKNQTDLTISIPLPLWNKNKGNIRMAKTLVEQAEMEKKSQEVEVTVEVKSAYLKYVEQKTNYELVNSSIPKNLEKVYEGIYSNFIKRNISMLEFTDFLESYNQSIISLNQISKSFINACEEINFSTASKLF